MNTPILAELKDRLLSMRFYTQNGDLEYVLDLVSEALDLTSEAIKQVQGAREDAHRMAGRVQVCTELYDMLAPNECAFDRNGLLDWTLEKNGLADAMELLKAGEQPTPAITRAIDDIRDEQPANFGWVLSAHPTLKAAFARLELLDANGASATETDIRDWVQFGMLPPDVAARFADEINEACDYMEKEEE